MKEFPGPTLIQQVGTQYILWFENSNQYIVIAKSLYKLIEAFLASENDSQFVETASELGYDSKSANQFHTEIGQFLEDCNKKPEKDLVNVTSFSRTNRNLSHYYQIDDKTIAVHYGSEALRSLVHPQLEHIETTENKEYLHCTFDILAQENILSLFKDEKIIRSWKSKDYHLLQGKFAMYLLCALHENEELDWMGTFHASTVAKDNKSIMIIGDSGKGKSTFTALLLSYGFEIVADDLTPVLAKDCKIYPYPGGISIKAGSFDLLKNSLSNFDKLNEHYINPYKGYVKYIGSPKPKGYLHGYPCKTMVRIQYTKGAETSLQPISISEALGTLIPESWLAADRYNAQQFLNWIKDFNFYELSYSDNQEAIDLFSKLIIE